MEIQEAPISARKKRQQKKMARREKKRAKRTARKEAYRALSTKKKIWYWGKRALIIAGCFAVLGVIAALAWQPVAEAFVTSLYEDSKARQASQEEILEVAAPDEAGAARVAALPGYDSDDTWAIYLYLCGSNLESFKENDLSDITAYMLQPAVESYQAVKSEERQKRIFDFVSDINGMGMDLPDSMYLIQKPQEAAEEEPESLTTTQEGCATSDLKEMFAVELPENIQIVIQTGGATRWTSAQFNPNRSQRFLYDATGFHTLSEGPVQNMGDSETLGDFLSFCKEDYPADHTVMLFWNHGGGAFGLCSDDLYGGDMLSLAEMRDALSNVYTENPENPPFELIGFDACLMASTEVADALYGFGRYMAASEEVEPGEGWNHTAWLTALAEHPEMNGAQLGKIITDSYIEHYANQSIQLSWIGIDYACTFSVLDINKAHTVYNAYTQLASVMLKAAIDDPLSLVKLGRAVDRSVCYGDSSYYAFNTIDLGLFTENLLDDYPLEAGAVQSALQDCVLYDRATSYSRDSRGLSIYFPAHVSEIYGLLYFLDYSENICQSEDIKALYYYKVAGCLNESLQAYADGLGYGTAKTLDTSALRKLAEAPVTLLDDGNYSLPVDAEVAKFLQSWTFCLAKFDAADSKATNFGEDLLAYMDDDNQLVTGFDGRWYAINGNYLALEWIMETESVIQYRAPVRVNDEDCYLLLAYDRANDLMSITGLNKMDFTATVAGRNVQNLMPGDKLQVIYTCDDPETGASMTEYGKAFTYKADSGIEPYTLEDGAYLSYITAYDLRDNEYNSQVVEFTMANGQMQDAKVSDEFIYVRTD